MQSCEFVTYVTALACAISNCSSKEELPLIAATLTQLGDTLATMLAQEELCSSKNREEER
ncbi:MAG TPA: DUF6774 domain-containing protein [Lachnospiraceae bacterium]|jgi:hypothetical protein|nr:DUF6774 domain-containing protein [Lachnospiraceae bacterium]